MTAAVMLGLLCAKQLVLFYQIKAAAASTADGVVATIKAVCFAGLSHPVAAICTLIAAAPVSVAAAAAAVSGAAGCC